MPGSDSVQLSFKALTGEDLTAISVKRSSTVGSIVKQLTERVPLPAKKIYTLVLGTDLLGAGDVLDKHVSGDAAELVACVETDDESDESAAGSKKGSKAKKKNASSDDSSDGSGKKKKGKKDKKSSKNKKDKKKEKAKKEKKGKKDKKTKSSSEEPTAKKPKRDRSALGIFDEEEDLKEKKAWVADKLDELRQQRPPLPMELCLIKAQQAWVEKREKDEKERIDEIIAAWPPMVVEAMDDAREEARKAGKTGEDLEIAADKAGAFALKVAKDNGLWKDPHFDPDEDPTKVPMMFQQRRGLERTIKYLQHDDCDHKKKKLGPM